MKSDDDTIEKYHCKRNKVHTIYASVKIKNIVFCVILVLKLYYPCENGFIGTLINSNKLNTYISQ